MDNTTNVFAAMNKRNEREIFLLIKLKQDKENWDMSNIYVNLH